MSPALSPLPGSLCPWRSLVSVSPALSPLSKTPCPCRSLFVVPLTALLPRPLGQLWVQKGPWDKLEPRCPLQKDWVPGFLWA